ncbi:MAG: glutaminase A [Vulcanimicrobiota bacterium]
MELLSQLYERYRDLDEGVVANYIPELAKADPSWFGISLVGVDGQVSEVGDSRRNFTIQSVSKPFVYGMALEHQGRAAVLERVGVEPTGDAFNSIIRLDEKSKRPYNPMVNAGAIAITALLPGQGPTQKLNRVLDTFGAYVGHEVLADMSVFMSERTSGHRNRAIAHLMLNFGMIEEKVEEILDLYFQQCSLLINATDLAVMAATLANGGVNPTTGVRAIEGDYVRDILSVMFTCGLYDYTGEWVYSVGLPAKSGVGGGLLAVVPGRMGIGVFSPPLDARGNSVRAIRVCQDLSARLGLHVFEQSLPSEKTAEFEAVKADHQSPSS